MRLFGFMGVIAIAAAMCSVVHAEEAVEPVELPAVIDLEAAQRIAIANNPSLRAAEARIRQASMRTLQAASAFYPQITAGVSGSKTEFSQAQLRDARKAVRDGSVASLQQQIGALAQAGAVGGGTFFQATSSWAIQTYGLLDIDESTEMYTANVTASWLLFDGFEREFTYRASRFAKKESEEAYREAQRLLLAAVAGAYYQAQLAWENTLIAQADEEFNERLLKESEARKRVGAGSLSDVLNFRVQKNRARAALIEAERGYQVARLGLAELIAAPNGVLPESVKLSALDAERPGEMTLPQPGVKLQYAYQSRPDMRQLNLGVKRSNAIVNARRGPFYPTAAISVSRSNSSMDELDFDSDNWATTWSFSFTYTFFTGGRNWAALREAKAIRDEVMWSEEALQNQVTREVRTAIENLRAAQQSLILQRSNAESAARNRDLVEKGYDVGQDSLVRLTQAERDFTSARAQLALALVSLRSAWHDLETATAERLETVENW